MKLMVHFILGTAGFHINIKIGDSKMYKKGNPVSPAGGACFYYRFSWLHLTRPLTFTGTISPVIVGTLFAAYQGSIRFDLFVAMLMASVLIQAATNMFNDYFDLLNGQDKEKWIVGEGIESVHGPAHHQLPYAAGALLTAAAIVGLWLAQQSSFWIIPFGVLGILTGYAYSAGQHSFSSIGLGETVAAIFLGFVPASLAYFIQGYPINLLVFLIALPFALVISTMILTNNLRDFKKDQGFRKTIAIIIGKRMGIRLLTFLLSFVYLLVMAMIYFQIISWYSVAALFAIPLAFRLRWSFRSGASRAEEVKSMKIAALHHWTFSLLFIAGMLFGL